MEAESPEGKTNSCKHNFASLHYHHLHTPGQDTELSRIFNVSSGFLGILYHCRALLQNPPPFCQPRHHTCPAVSSLNVSAACTEPEWIVNPVHVWAGEVSHAGSNQAAGATPDVALPEFL